MGMFDYINYGGNCPKCGAALGDWQSKDGPCIMATLQPWEVKEFYTDCKCGAWIDAKVDAEVEHIVKRCDVKLTMPNVGGKRQ